MKEGNPSSVIFVLTALVQLGNEFGTNQRKLRNFCPKSHYDLEYLTGQLLEVILLTLGFVCV